MVLKCTYYLLNSSYWNISIKFVPDTNNDPAYPACQCMMLIYSLHRLYPQININKVLINRCLYILILFSEYEIQEKLLEVGIRQLGTCNVSEKYSPSLHRQQRRDHYEILQDTTHHQFQHITILHHFLYEIVIDNQITREKPPNRSGRNRYSWQNQILQGLGSRLNYRYLLKVELGRH